jgi:heparanase 1
MRIAVAALGVMLLAGCHGCERDPEMHPAHVAIATDRVAATVSDRFVSVAVDTAQVVGGDFWTPGVASSSGVGPVAPFDFTRPRLDALTRALAPAYLRVGGTDADRTWYALGETVPASPPANYKWILTRKQLDGLFDFAKGHDLQLMFTLNAGRGPRTADDGPWLSDNARTMVDYAAKQAAPVAVWELGNEVNAYVVTLGFSLSPEDYVRDVRLARALVGQLTPSAKLAAPASAYWPLVGELGGLLPAFAHAGGGDSVDILSWHYYPQQSGRCGVAVRSATPTRLLDADNLDEIDRWADDVDQAHLKWAPRTEVWLGETSNAQCGGAPGISDAHVSSLWWLDELGKMARRGTQVVVRQSLTGADYGLLAEPTLAPRPDYFATLLWKRLMGTRVLAAAVPTPPWTLRAYAHCAAGDVPAGAVTVLLINLDQAQAQTLEIDGVGKGGQELWTVSAPSLSSPVAELNGATMAVAEDGTPPALEPLRGRGRSVTVPPASYAFVRFADANAAGCQ